MRGYAGYSALTLACFRIDLVRRSATHRGRQRADTVASARVEDVRSSAFCLAIAAAGLVVEEVRRPADEGLVALALASEGVEVLVGQALQGPSAYTPAGFVFDDPRQRNVVAALALAVTALVVPDVNRTGADCFLGAAARTRLGVKDVLGVRASARRATDAGTLVGVPDLWERAVLFPGANTSAF